MNDKQIRFYIACILAQLSSRQVKNTIDRLIKQPGMTIADALKVCTTRYGRGFLLFNTEPILEGVTWRDIGFNTDLGRNTNIKDHYQQVWRQILVFCIISSANAHEQEILERRYLTTVPKDHWIRSAWQIMQGLSSVTQSDMRGYFLDSPLNIRCK